MDKEVSWAIELNQLFENKNIVKIREKLFHISDVLVYLHEVLAEQKINFEDKDIYSEQLIIKFYLQNLSLIDLSNGISIKSNFFSDVNSTIKFLDLSSIITIVRSLYETLLMYQHLYINSDNDNVQKLRFESWIMSSMMLRSKVYFQTHNIFSDNRKDELNSINILKESIKNNPEFINLTLKQQNQLLENGSGKLFKSWDKIFDDSKFNRDGVLANIYYMASIYAHSEGIFALQLKQSKHLMEDENMKESNYLMLFYSYLMTNIMIKNISNKFPLIKERFEKLDEKIKFEIDYIYQLCFK